MDCNLSINEIARLAMMAAQAESCWRYRRQSLQAGEDRFENFTIDQCSREMKICRALKARLDYLEYHMDGESDYEFVYESVGDYGPADAYREAPLDA